MNKSFWPLFSLCGLLLIFACEPASTPKLKPKYQQVKGSTMGTTYSVNYLDSLNTDWTPEIEALLFQINKEVNTYDDSSLISVFNRSDFEFPLEADLYTTVFKPTQDHHFRQNYGFATQVYMMTDGAFDPTVMPLVNYWGFGYAGKDPVTAVDSQAVDSLQQLVGFDKIHYSSEMGKKKLIKLHPGVQLDFSALAKGYAVDAIAEMLESEEVENYLVEIGGELRAKGKNKRGKWWVIGINTPEEGAPLTKVFSKMKLEDKALATSGNYRNYYKVGEYTYSHTINPETGFPERSNLLSVSVLAESCILADAYATAFMVMGLDKSFKFAEKDNALEAYFIYRNEKGDLLTRQTSGLEKILQ